MYLALYRKYRPKTFDDVISQPHITTTLRNQIKTSTSAHAYLLTGSRGTGKTTCAKILAMAINCLSPKDGNPCLECSACREIENGATDVVEMDAASNNGVDDVRVLRDEVAYTPVSCKYRVYIIDEVHMLTTAAFNALLKTLEEPPPHVVFILATTETHKVPATILSRCQRFEFRRIDMEDSADRLMSVAENEKINLDRNAALFISRLSDGGMRDALSILDQCIGISENITTDIVRESAGIAGREHLFALADCVKNSDTANALKILDELHKGSKDIGRLLEELIGHFRNLMLLKVMPNDTSLVSALPDEIDTFIKQNEGLSMSLIMRSLSLLQECGESLSRSKQRKTLAEMYLIKLCNVTTDSSAAALSERLERLENALSDGTPITIERKAPIPETAKSENSPQPNKQDNSDISKRAVSGAVSDMLSKIHELADARSGEIKSNSNEEKNTQPVFDDEVFSEDTDKTSENIHDEPLPFDLDEPSKNDRKEENTVNQDAPKKPVFVTSEDIETPEETPKENDEDIDGQVGFDIPSEKPTEPQALKSEEKKSDEKAISEKQEEQSDNVKAEEAETNEDFYPFEEIPFPDEISVPSAEQNFVLPPFDDFGLPPPEREELMPPEFSQKSLRTKLPDAPPEKPLIIKTKVEFSPSELNTTEENEVKEWAEICEKAPLALGSVLDGSKAYYHENFIHIYPIKTLLESLLNSGTNKERLEKVISDILGKRYKAVVISPKVTNSRESTTLEKFFVRARELGINVKIIEK